MSSEAAGGGGEAAEGGDGGGGEELRPQGANAGRAGQGGTRPVDQMSLQVSETFFLSSAAVLRPAGFLGPLGPADAASARGPGR